MGLCDVSVYSAEKFKYGKIVSDDAEDVCEGIGPSERTVPSENAFVDVLVQLPEADRFAIAHQPQDFIRLLERLS